MLVHDRTIIGSRCLLWQAKRVIFYVTSTSEVRSRMHLRSDCLLPISLAATLVLGNPTPATALECPVYHPSDTDAASKETRAQTESFAAMLAARGDRATHSIVNSVRTAHPNVSAAEITNFVLTLYCPLVRHNAALSEDQKRARLKSFSADLMKQASR